MRCKVCIDAGHGGSDPGAINGRYLEKDAALDIALKAGTKLALAGVNVIYTRTIDMDLELRPRTSLANTMSADCFISIHCNAAGSKQANGIETYAYSTASDGYRLAELVHAELISRTGASDRGVKTANFHVLRETKMPAILVEAGFISNDREMDLLFDDKYQNALATAIYRGVRAYLKLDE